MGFK
jgi:hypothetical protein